MFGSAAVAACCGVAPRADTSRTARVLAVVMALVMAAAAVESTVAVAQYVGAPVLLALAVALIGGGPAELSLVEAAPAESGLVEAVPADPDPGTQWHRAAEAVLMAFAVLTHGPGGWLADHQAAVAPGVGHGSGAGLDLVLVLLRAATAGYLCWIVVVLVRLRHRPIIDLRRGEHLAMGVSLTTMIFFR